MRKIVVCLIFLPMVIGLLFASCKLQHEIALKAPEEAIKVDVKIEAHIYQHVVQDITYITGGAPAEKTEPKAPPTDATEKESPPPSESKGSGAGDVFLRLLGIGTAYAETASDQGQLRAVLDSMRKRYSVISAYRADKSIGENHRGYLEERPSPRMSDPGYAQAVRAAIAAQNADRLLLYQIRARMDRTTVEKQAAFYAKAWRDNTRPGEWIEVFDEKDKKWVWKTK